MCISIERGDDLRGPVALRKADEWRFKVFSDLSEIKEISHEWDALLAASQCNRAFSSPEWFIASCRLSSPSVPYVIAAVLGEEMVGILPLVLDREAGVASFPHYLNDYNDVIARGDSPSLVAGLLSYTISLPGRCKKVVLEKLRQDSNCVKAMPFIAGRPNADFTHREISRYLCISLPRSFEDYVASRGRKLRKGIRYDGRAIEKSRLTVLELEPGIFDARLLSELVISLAIARQKEESVFQQPSAQAFVREVLPPLFLKGGVRAFAILEGERVIAMDICMASPNGLGLWNGGFLPEAGQWSPGKILMAFGIKKSIEMGFNEYDLMLGEEAYKTSWANSSYTVHEVQLALKA